jgi:hypothetical protein
MVGRASLVVLLPHDIKLLVGWHVACRTTSRLA